MNRKVSLAAVVIFGGAAGAARVDVALLLAVARRNDMPGETPRDCFADRVGRLRVILRAIHDRKPLTID